MKKFDNLGLDNIKEIFHNLSYDELNAHEKANNEGLSTDNDTFVWIREFLQVEVLKINIL